MRAASTQLRRQRRLFDSGGGGGSAGSGFSSSASWDELYETPSGAAAPPLARPPGMPSERDLYGPLSSPRARPGPLQQPQPARRVDPFLGLPKTASGRRGGRSEQEELDDVLERLYSRPGETQEVVYRMTDSWWPWGKSNLQRVAM
jgi:hypothetical protein